MEEEPVIPHHLLVLSLESKIFVGFYNALVIIIGCFGNIIVLYCSIKHGESYVLTLSTLCP